MLNFLSGGLFEGGGMSILMIVAMIAVFYFLMIRPENKRKKEAEQMRSAVKPGDEIITIGGVVGTVVSVKEDKFVLSSPSGQFLPTRLLPLPLRKRQRSVRKRRLRPRLLREPARASKNLKASDRMIRSLFFLLFFIG